MPSDPNMIVASSSVHASDRAPWVHLLWGEKRAQLTPEDARQFALSVLAAAEAAEQDALLVKFFTERGADFGMAVGILDDFRQMRERNGGPAAPRPRVQ